MKIKSETVVVTIATIVVVAFCLLGIAGLALDVYIMWVKALAVKP